jgi:hypothetical protein
MIREIPAGRTVQLSVWRDGRSQTISVTLGKAEEHRHAWKMATPGTFAFQMPDMPVIPEIPSMEWSGTVLMGGQPRLGIDAEDLSGQLGAFFGAPDGEGILVREVSPGSAAEKAGVKAGDVITSFNGERVHSLGDLREKLSAKRDEKDKTAKLGVLRNKSEISLSVELPAPQARTKHIVSRRTHIKSDLLHRGSRICRGPFLFSTSRLILCSAKLSISRSSYCTRFHCSSEGREESEPSNAA